MPNASHPPSVARIIAFVLIGAGGGFYLQNSIETQYKERQLEAYEAYLKKSKATKK
jgi:hypothetical protein